VSGVRCQEIEISNECPMTGADDDGSSMRMVL
jgi:hypothetical protein